MERRGLNIRKGFLKFWLPMMFGIVAVIVSVVALPKPIVPPPLRSTTLF